MTEVTIGFETGRQARAAKPRAPVRRYPARVARQIALARALEGRVARGEFLDLAAMARALGFTRARVTQLMDLLLLAPDIQEEILFLEIPPGPQPLTERTLRDTLRSFDWQVQRERWARLKSKLGI